jgi:hypothetical protein
MADDITAMTQLITDGMLVKTAETEGFFDKPL